MTGSVGLAAVFFVDLLNLFYISLPGQKIAKRLSSTIVTAPMLFMALGFLLAQTGILPVAGVVAGVIGGRALLSAQGRGWTGKAYEGVGVLALAGGAYLAATAVGGNGFIAAFVAGLSFGHVVKGRCPFVYEFTKSEGQLLT